ncbi:MAG: 50S ribosomal protein L32 [Patescibacteria group bacterium]|nr:50S ribosomal protein L32 [Patescibacteria group bacterium]MDE1943967.1 50S ribosomal protein L32 [Patescibacteria group bacterium]MDE1944898.1 50S ribosomal protein L32 [Patescibacteria group bacterium]MDE2057329.1 50S ribosomal protein L32 [Patescibacteria group bacterium]
MSVRMRHTKGHTHNRRSHHALAAIATRPGQEAGALVLPHRVDEATGLYRGMQIAAPKKVRKTKAERHDHPHGTHHEHVHEEVRSEAKPVETSEAPAALSEEKKAGTRKRSPRASKQDPGA